MTELTSMVNIGGEMARKLRAVGIGSAEELMETGAKGAFFRLKTLYPQVCLVHLYALEGAVQNVEFNNLPQAQKRDLKAFSDCLRSAPPEAETPNHTEEEDTP